MRAPRPAVIPPLYRQYRHQGRNNDALRHSFFPFAGYDNNCGQLVVGYSARPVRVLKWWVLQGLQSSCCHGGGASCFSDSVCSTNQHRQQQSNVDNMPATPCLPQHHGCTAGCGSSTEQATAHPEMSVRPQNFCSHWHAHTCAMHVYIYFKQ